MCETFLFLFAIGLMHTGTDFDMDNISGPILINSSTVWSNIPILCSPSCSILKQINVFVVIIMSRKCFKCLITVSEQYFLFHDHIFHVHVSIFHWLFVTWREHLATPKDHTVILIFFYVPRRVLHRLLFSANSISV